METNPAFIIPNLGSKLGRGGKVYLANPECVDWKGTNAAHPDELDTICYGRTPCKLVRRAAFQRMPTSWKRQEMIDGQYRTVEITLHERMEHILTFVTPNGKVIEYTHFVPVGQQLETREVLSA